MSIAEFAKYIGIETCLEFPPAALFPEERIRRFCKENKCGNYGRNYMCPPFTGTQEELKVKLGKFRHGLLLQYAREMDVKGDTEGVITTKIDFHHKILELEQFLKKQGIERVWGMIGGNCELCRPCKVVIHEPCTHPDLARTSLEAIAVDVMGLLDRCGLDSKFYDDRIVWTGCILY